MLALQRCSHRRIGLGVLAIARPRGLDITHSGNVRSSDGPGVSTSVAAGEGGIRRPPLTADPPLAGRSHTYALRGPIPGGHRPLCVRTGFQLCWPPTRLAKGNPGLSAANGLEGAADAAITLLRGLALSCLRHDLAIGVGHAHGGVRVCGLRHGCNLQHQARPGEPGSPSVRFGKILLAGWRFSSLV
jgi:hypothetical protein